MELRQLRRQNLSDLMLKVYHTEQHDYLEYKIREIRGIPTVAASTTAFITLDGSVDGELSFLATTVYPTSRGHVVSVAYPKKDADYIESEFHAFSFQSDRDFEEAISEFILINPYNTFLSPIRWQQFSQMQKQTIEQQVLAHEFSTQKTNGIIIPAPQAISMINLFKVL